MRNVVIGGTGRNKTHKARLDLLGRLRNKGAAWQSQNQVDSLMKAVRSIAHGHYNLGEGAEEFYDVVNKIITKYSNARP